MNKLLFFTCAFLLAAVTYAKYGFQDEAVESDTFQSASLNFYVETVAEGMDVPYSMDFLPGGDMLVTDRGGKVYSVDPSGKTTPLSGVPEVRAKGQGGMHHVLLHPDFERNKYVYLSYGALKKEGGKKLTTTKVTRHKLEGTTLSDETLILEALPYTTAGYHFGSVMHFDAAGHLFITVGDRGERDVNPQDLSRFGGKIHRVNDDGSIPTDVGSLRYKYLNLVRLDGERVVSEEPLMKNIGRLRFVKEGPDGFIYVGVEDPGRILRLRTY